MIKTKSKAYIILIKKLVLLGVLFFSTSCATYITYLEKEEASHIHEIPKKEAPLFCPIHSRPRYNLIHESEFGIKEFSSIMKSIEENRSMSKKNLSITEWGLLYTLYNSFVRPDATNWNARLQFYIKEGSKSYYYDFHEDQLNFEKAIYTFKSIKLSRLSPAALLNMAQGHFPSKLTVQKKFSTYLDGHQSKLKAQHLKKYFRLGKPLQKGETFRISPKSFSITKRRFSPSKEAPLFKVKNSQLSQCNFDTKLYESGIFIIHDDNLNENIFAIVKDNGDYILIASSAGDISRSHKNLSQSEVVLPKFNTPICRYQDESKSILSIAYDSRDSGQLLHHLNQYQYFNSKSIDEVIQYTSYARHLFLTNPPRMLYESKRGTPQELNNYLALNFPVYHASSIGLIQSFVQFKDVPSTFVEDIRSDTFQSCIK